MDRADLRTEIRALVQDTDTNNPHWSDDILNNRINYAQIDICSRTSCIEKRPGTYTDIVANTAEYLLPTDYLYATRVAYKDSSDNWKHLPEITAEDLDNRYLEWESDTATEPTNYIIRGAYIRLYPTPNEARTAGLRIDYINVPADLDDDADTPYDAVSSLTPFHYLICMYVAYLCKIDEKNAQEANLRFNDYLARIRDMKSRLSERFENRRILNVYESTRSRSLRASSTSTNPFTR